MSAQERCYDVLVDATQPFIMTSDDRQVLIEERDRLRAQVHALSAQLQELVEVENALVRARAEGERQLDRIDRLAGFALKISGVTEPDDVLAQARRTLLEQFELDEAVALYFDGTEPVVAIRGGNTWRVDPGVWSQLTLLRGVAITAATEPLAQALLAIIGNLIIGPTSTAFAVTWIPIRPNTGDLVLLCGWTSRDPSDESRPATPARRSSSSSTPGAYRDAPRPEHIPFLELFGEHVKRAIDSAEFTSTLRRQGAQLTDSNRRLQASLQELGRAQAQLVQAQKLEALGRLANGIAHDFNNLLTVIVTHAHLVRPALELQPEPQAEAKADLEVVVDAAMRAAEITQRLLAFSRKRESHQGAVDINAITIELSHILRRWIGDNIFVELNLDPGVGRIRADAADLEQILTNLVVNARDAMSTGGTVTIETRHATSADDPSGNPSATARMIALSVRDTGTGMDDETCRQLFEPFFTTKPIGNGTGLGLATVYGLVTKNQGRIHVKSSVGAGSCFTVLLPSADGIRGADLHAPTTATRGSVLVVEDEEAIRRMICRVLRKLGFDITEAGDGEQALQLAQRLPSLDLLITDVAMPTMNGPELVDRLRPLVPRLRVVYISGYTFEHLDITKLDSSSERFLRKPFTPEQLQSVVDNAIA